MNWQKSQWQQPLGHHLRDFIIYAKQEHFLSYSITFFSAIFFIERNSSTRSSNSGKEGKNFANFFFASGENLFKNRRWQVDWKNAVRATANWMITAKIEVTSSRKTTTTSEHLIIKSRKKRSEKVKFPEVRENSVRFVYCRPLNYCSFACVREVLLRENDIHRLRAETHRNHTQNLYDSNQCKIPASATIFRHTQNAKVIGKKGTAKPKSNKRPSSTSADCCQWHKLIQVCSRAPYSIH